jgi:hypothetical protein
MKATIHPYFTDDLEAKGFIILFTNSEGRLVDSTTVTEVHLDSGLMSLMDMSTGRNRVPPGWTA